MRVSVCLELELEQYVLTATKIFERQNSQNFNGSVSFAKATNTNVKFTRGVREIRSIVLFVIRRNHGKWHFDIFGYFCFTAAAAFHLTYQVCVSVCVYLWLCLSYYFSELIMRYYSIKSVSLCANMEYDFIIVHFYQKSVRLLKYKFLLANYLLHCR